MTRLRNEAGLDPISERGIEMLRRTPATHRSLDRKRRVWVSLQRTAVRNALRRSAGLSGLLLAMAGVAVATTAMAAIGGRWISTAGARGGAPATATVGPTPRARGAAARRIAEHEQLPPSEPGGGEAIRPAPARRAERPAAPARPAVLDALVTLRRDHDAARAALLLDGYLAANRHGALREEALALAIEAADAERDPPRARLFAGAYASEYPSGRFALYARRHLGEGSADVPPR